MGLTWPACHHNEVLTIEVAALLKLSTNVSLFKNFVGSDTKANNMDCSCFLKRFVDSRSRFV